MTDHAQQTVVLHVSDSPDDVARAATTAEAIRASFPSVQVRIIVNGEALSALTQADAPPGVEACEIGMARRGIETAHLAPGVGTVASAAVELAGAQFAGAAYIRI
ncbi:MULTISPECIES: DsrE family protein [Microbacterium]|jgi:intracellular sulfur oxidation DsrE/DsrF family protein|uniref:DsrE family protein n=1 Tax=Microbacterium TaxID=33882 RepID=UPI0010F99EB8|nr:hypothetical protein [Microbacterium sp. 4NA327F11]MCK9914211.1 hypothetical protein [Microbacteriaceae bacterium K1510]